MGGKYWTASHSVAYGCRQTDPACAGCWAALLVHRWESNPCMSLIKGFLTDHKGRWTGAVHVLERKLLPERGRAHVIAMNWIGDLFYKEVPLAVVYSALDAVAWNAWQRARLGSPPHAYLFLTHQPALMVKSVLEWLRMRTEEAKQLLNQDAGIFAVRGAAVPAAHFRRAVWWGASVTRQGQLHAAHEITDLPGNHWLSCEPIEGPIRLGVYARDLEWITAGTSTTNKAMQTREHSRHVIGLAQEAAERGIPIWIKQGVGPVIEKTDRQMPAAIKEAFGKGAPRDRLQAGGSAVQRIS